MSHTYIPSWRRNYNRYFCCINNPHDYNEWGFFVNSLNKYVPCTNKYCQVHGEKQRQQMDDNIQHRLKGKKCITHCSSHYGKTQEYKKCQASANYFAKLIRTQIPSSEVVVINHWKVYKKKHYKHHHLIIASDNPIPRAKLKALHIQALTNHEIDQPSKKRMGYRVYDTPQHALDYCLFLGKNKNKIVYPPADVKWEMVRLPRIKELPKSDSQGTSKLGMTT